MEIRMDEYNNNPNENNNGWQNGGNGQNNGYGNGNGYQGGYENQGYQGSYDNGPNGYWRGDNGWSNSPVRRLAKSSTNRLVCGVCAGIAEYFGWDPTIVRLVWIAASVILGAGFLGVAAYFIAAVVMPEM